MIKKLQLPPGEYCVSDPCHFMDKDQYQDWLNAFFQIKNADVFWFGEGESEKNAFLVTSDFGGDGVYDGSITVSGNKEAIEVPVDAGMVGLFPSELCGRKYSRLKHQWVGRLKQHWVHFERPVTVEIKVSKSGMTDGFQATDGIKTVSVSYV